MENPQQHHIWFMIFLFLGLIGLGAMIFTQSILGIIGYFLVYLTITFYIIQKSYEKLYPIDKTIIISSMNDSQYPNT